MPVLTKRANVFISQLRGGYSIHKLQYFPQYFRENMKTVEYGEIKIIDTQKEFDLHAIRFTRNHMQSDSPISHNQIHWH